MKEELTHAIAVEGSISALARSMGLSKQRVWAWKKSLPEPWRLVLRTKYGRRKPKNPPKEQA